MSVDIFFLRTFQSDELLFANMLIKTCRHRVHQSDLGSIISALFPLHHLSHITDTYAGRTF